MTRSMTEMDQGEDFSVRSSDHSFATLGLVHYLGNLISHDIMDGAEDAHEAIQPEERLGPGPKESDEDDDS
jgi:hypothetical protein